MSALSDALAALKTMFLLEERVSSQSRKVEKLADQIAEMDRRLARMEGQIQGFVAGASAFSAASRPAASDYAPPKLSGPKG